MKATEFNCLAFLKKPAQFQIPIYQRPYSWTQRQCRQLWDDILRSGRDDQIDSHFVGSVVYVHDGVFVHADVPKLVVIDGQQRLTTISLFILALAEELEKRSEDQRPAGVDSAKLRNYHLINAQEQGEERYKLLLTYGDRETLRRLIDGRPLKEFGTEASPRIVENYTAFRAWLAESDVTALGAVYKGLGKLMMIDVSLEREHDDPQLIFESLNSTGLALSQADLIRNYVLMGLPTHAQQQLYENHWKPMERAFGQDAYVEHFDRFVRHYLTMKTRQIPRIRQVYREYKRYSQGKPLFDMVAELHRFAGHYVQIACIGPEVKTRSPFKHVLQQLVRLQVDTAVPFLLEVYDDCAAGIIGAQTMRGILEIIETYVFRRVLCDVPTNTLNRTFATLATRINKADEGVYYESVQAALMLMKGNRRLPTDQDLADRLLSKDIYGLRTCDYLLEKLENQGHKEWVDTSQYTIEHILPQNPQLGSTWREALGPDWKAKQARLLHTLGNLTLTGYNSELKDKPFLEKRDHAPGGFIDSKLWLNRSLGKMESWDDKAIERRTVELTGRVMKVWPLPTLSEEILDRYHMQMAVDTSQPSYSMDRFKHLADAKIQTLFEVFQNEIMGLDDRIRRKVKKHYIAFGVDVHLVCVVPHKNHLALFLNVPPTLLKDEQQMVKDVTAMGHWGTGDSKVFLRDSHQIDTVMKLIRQVFEYHTSDNQLNTSDGD